MKKWKSIILCMILLIVCTVPVQAALPFQDIKSGEWYEEPVNYVYENGYMTGMTDDKFGPYDTLSRAQFACVLHRMDGEPAISYNDNFPDVKADDWYAVPVAWAQENGIISGYSNGKFGPADNITREQIAAILHRYALYSEYQNNAEGNLDSFPDNDKISSYFVDDMKWAVGVGILSGKSNGNLDPRGFAGRAECAAMIQRYYENSAGSDVGEISFQQTSAENIVTVDSETALVNNEILLTAEENTEKSVIEELVKEYGGTVVGCIEITNDYQIQFPNALSTDELTDIVNQLSENENILDASIHYLYNTEYEAVPNDTKWKNDEWSAQYPGDDNWGIEAIDAMGAWDHLGKMKYVNVGLVDSMFDTSHEDLKYTKVWNNPNSIAGVADGEHGTHVSGTIAAGYNNGKGVAGVAPKVRLYGYSILGNSTDSVVTDSQKSMIGYMEWKYALAKLITSNCKVINVSMAYHGNYESQNEIFGDFLNKLIQKNYDFVIVQAAGNDSSETSVSGLFTGITIPEVKNRIIIVGAMGNNGSHKNGLFGWFGDRIFDGYYYAHFSNYGERVDIVAPGVDIYSTVPGSKYEGGWEGTSMAAPHVSGIAAMCYSVNPGLTGSQVKNIVVSSSSTNITDMNEGHTRADYPVADADAAVELAISTDGNIDSPVNPSTGIVMGNVRGYDDNHTAGSLEDASISAYRISDNEGNLSEYSSSAKSDADGNYELILEAGEYYINIYKDGYLPFAFYKVAVTNDQITYLDNVILISDSGAEASNDIKGTVYNALNGNSISDVTIKLRPGWNNRSGALAQDINTNADAAGITDANGAYSFHVLEGCYTAELIKEGYVTGYTNVVCTNMNNTSQDAVLSPVLSESEYRVVLTWSSSPSDLDSHASGPLSAGDFFHVYYSKKTATDNDLTVATLDYDDTSSYGPETITLNKTLDGVYKYSVHDYSNRNNSSSTALSMSGAKVQVYAGNALIAEYSVPINKAGTVWDVFEIEGDSIRPLNTLRSVVDPENVLSNSAVNSLSEEEYFEDNKDYNTEGETTE